MRQLDFPVQIMDKDFSYFEGDDIRERFVSQIIELATHGVTYTIDKQDEQLDQVVDIDPFEIPLALFMQKPLLEREKLMNRAREIAAKTIDKEFSEGKIWVFLCGSKELVRASAFNPNEILSEEELMSFAKIQQRAPFHYFQPLEVEDIWTQCGDNSQLKNYPTVTLEFQEGPIIAHFDTGAPWTIFSYEALLVLEPTFPNRLFTETEIGPKDNGTKYSATYLDVDVLLRCQITDQTKPIRITGQAVRDWESLGAPFMRECKTKCVKPGGKVNRNGRWFCPERKALIGRNLLVDNKLILFLDGAKCKTGFAIEIKNDKED